MSGTSAKKPILFFPGICFAKMGGKVFFKHNTLKERFAADITLLPSSASALHGVLAVMLACCSPIASSPWVNHCSTQSNGW